MFKFGFDLDLEDDVEDFGGVEPSPSDAAAAAQDEVVPSAPFRELAFDDLFGTLPPSLSYCPLPLPSHVPSSVAPIVRRDMFDAQFQLIASAAADDDDEDEAGAGAGTTTAKSWGPETDLVKGVYEGGMKTWECASDLVGVLDRELVKGQGWRAVEGKKIMEVGCGTAIPSVYLLQELLAKPEDASAPSIPPPQTTFYFLDYNEVVLQLVTLPNIILAFRDLLAPPTETPAEGSAKTSTSTAIQTADASAHRSTSPAPSSADGAESDDDDGDSAADEDASLTLGASRLKRFRELLARRNIVLRFFSGGWESFALAEGDGKMDVVLTSETVYQATNLPDLVALLRQASAPATTTLVAAKVLYFGLEGGGVPAFEGAVQAGGGGGWTEEVWRSASGVKRWVGLVGWSP